MSASGSDTVILAARRPVAVALQGVLHDWMVQGLVSPAVVVDLDSLVDGQPAIPATVLIDGDARTAALQQYLAHSRVARVRLAMVGVVDEEETALRQEDAARLVDALLSSVPSATRFQLNVAAGSPGADWADRSRPIMGWHNVAVSPEESMAPSQGSVALTRSLEDPRWLLLLTGTLCSLTGLWPGQTRGPLDDVPAPAGRLVIPLRAFSRSLSSGSVQDALAERLVSVGDRYPIPRVDATFALSIDDEASAAVGMAEQLLTKHVDVMPRVRHRTPPPQPQKIGAWSAIKGFLGFALESLAKAPQNAIAALNRSVSQAAANAVQNAVFGGADSGFAVVVRGVRADGSSATWAEYEQSLDSVVRRAGPSGELEPVQQKPQLWHDFVDGGLTLLDAGTRSALPPRTLGSQRAVISTTGRVGPDPADTFQLPAQLAAFLPNWEIQAGDDIAVGRLFERLDHLAQSQPHLGQAVSNERNRLREWANRVRASYVGHVGRRLGDAHRATIDEVQDLTALVERLSVAPPAPDDVQRDQDELASNVRVMTGVSVSLIAILIALSALSVLIWPLLLLAILIILMSWAGIGAWLHVKSSAKVYAYANKLRAATTELEDATRHRIEALEDLRRVSRAYRQYLDWSRAFGAFIHAPLGTPSASAERRLHVGQGMPLNLAVGVAVADDEAVDDVANRWRGQLFRIGWLSDAWREYVTDLPASLGALRHHLQTDRTLLDNDPVIDGAPVLTRWSTALAERARQRPMSERVTASIVALTSGDAEARDRLLSRVRIRDNQGREHELSRTEFIEGLDRADVLGTLQPGMFNRAGAYVDAQQVRRTVPQVEAAGLDVALVVVQLAQALDPSALAGAVRAVNETPTLESSSDTFI